MIKNFIYVDSYKLRSISSQLFEGLTERTVRTSVETSTKDDTQKGPIGSGQILGDIFSRENSTSDLVFLEDHAFSILEAKLFDDELIDEISELKPDPSLDRKFLHVSAKLNFNDLKKTAQMMRSFNVVGESIWRVSNEPMGPLNGDKKILGDTEARKKAAEAGLQLHQKVADAAANLTEFGYGDMLEASMNVGNTLYVAPLKREFLRDTEEMFIHKYSRLSDTDFSMLGIITRVGKADEEEPDIPNVKDADDIKNAMRTLGLHVGTIERLFTGASVGEITIDPIAIYSRI